MQRNYAADYERMTPRMGRITLAVARAAARAKHGPDATPTNGEFWQAFDKLFPAPKTRRALSRTS